MSEEEILLKNINHGLDIVVDGLNFLVDMNIGNSDGKCVIFYEENSWLYSDILTNIAEKLRHLDEPTVRDSLITRLNEITMFKIEVDELYKSRMYT
jgi:hypothetical protein